MRHDQRWGQLGGQRCRPGDDQTVRVVAHHVDGVWVGEVGLIARWDTLEQRTGPPPWTGIGRCTGDLHQKDPSSDRRKSRHEVPLRRQARLTVAPVSASCTGGSESAFPIGAPSAHRRVLGVGQRARHKFQSDHPVVESPFGRIAEAGWKERGDCSRGSTTEESRNTEENLGIDGPPQLGGIPLSPGRTWTRWARHRGATAPILGPRSQTKPASDDGSSDMPLRSSAFSAAVTWARSEPRSLWLLRPVGTPDRPEIGSLVTHRSDHRGDLATAATTSHGAGRAGRGCGIPCPPGAVAVPHALPPHHACPLHGALPRATLALEPA